VLKAVAVELAYKIVQNKGAECKKMKRRGGRQVEKCRAGYQSGTNLLILLLAGREDEASYC
jgi:hypothetical protein